MTASPTASDTPTPVDTDTPTSTPTETETPSLTPTATPIPEVTQDDFSGSLLSPDWEWYLPVDGPTYSLTDNPDHFRMIVPPGFDYWIDLDNSPQLRRRDMGSGDWTIETSISLADTNAGASFEITLMVGFGQYDQLWLDAFSDGTLRVRRTGEDDYAITSAGLPLDLRIDKRGSQYSLHYKPSTESQWTILDTLTIGTPLSYVGILPRTFWNSSGTAAFDIEYFRLERFGTIDPLPYTETEIEDFNGPALSPGWEWYVPKAGPTYSLEAVPGSFEMGLPYYNNFNHWENEDDAPQLRRTGLGDADWDIEAMLGSITAEPGSIYLAGLEFGYDAYDQVWLGMDQDSNLQFVRVGEGPSYVGAQNLQVRISHQFLQSKDVNAVA